MVTNRTGPLLFSLWPSSRPLPIKPNPLSTTLPLTHPSLLRTAPHSLLPPVDSVFLSLYYYPITALTHHYPHTHLNTMPDASKPIQKNVPSHLVALPSLSNSLSSLPQAKNMAHVSVYTSSMSGQHAAESEAKVCTLPLSAPAFFTQVLIGTPPFAA
jgi:hypothetical protein